MTVRSVGRRVVHRARRVKRPHKQKKSSQNTGKKDQKLKKERRDITMNTHNDIAIYLPALLFFRSYNEMFVQTAFIPYFPSGKYYFSICDHGPDSLHAVYMRQIDIFYRGILRRSRRLQIFSFNNNRFFS